MRLFSLRFLGLSLLFSISSMALAQSRLIALTIDDLPFVGEAKSFHLDMITKTLKEKQVPATGFVIAREVKPDNMDALYAFKNAGMSVGNHSYSHQSVGELSTSQYLQQQIDTSDEILSPFMTQPKFYRFPYLYQGNGEKRALIHKHLKEKNYTIAPITVDSKDFMFNQMLLGVDEQYRRQYMNVLVPSYIEFIWDQTLKAEETNRLNKQDRPQILLIHANLLNAYALGTLIDYYREHGYKFITLSEALAANR